MGLRLDRIARHLARGPRSRRAALQASGLGVVTAMVHRVGLAPQMMTPATHGCACWDVAAQSTPGACPAAPVSEVSIDGAWLCRQPYALCTTASCERSASDATIATCRCVVLDGYSIGFTTCREREPVGKTLVSTFSTQNVKVPSASSPARRMFPGPTASTCPASSIPSTRRWQRANVKWWGLVPHSPSGEGVTHAHARR